jgi:glutamyl-tRNA synthetase
LGTSDPVVVRGTLEELVADFDLSKFSRAPAHFDPADLKTLNHKLLHGLSYDAVAGDLQKLGVGGGAAFWEAVRDNIELLKDARRWWQVVEGPLEPVIEDANVAAAARELLPTGSFTDATWGEWTAAVSAKTGAKGKALFRPLRLALTGQPHGPEMRKLLPLIGPERAAKRLAGQAA